MKTKYKQNEVVKVASYGLGLVTQVDATLMFGQWRQTYTVKMRNTGLVLTCPDGRHLSKTKYGVVAYDGGDQ